MTTSRRGRPSKAEHETVTGLHIDTGATVSWSDGVFAGDRDLVTLANERADTRERISVVPFQAPIPSGRETPRRAAAAILSTHPGRVILLTPMPPRDATEPFEDVSVPAGDLTVNLNSVPNLVH